MLVKILAPRIRVDVAQKEAAYLTGKAGLLASM